MEQSDPGMIQMIVQTKSQSIAKMLQWFFQEIPSKTLEIIQNPRNYVKNIF